ncbi:MAG TPA: hypothetical protein ENI46_00580 [Firmicutes bacterium]|nr:hypothetical protein [Bacillota bacterium]
MAFKVLLLAHAPDADPSVHRATIRTEKLDFTSIIVKNQAQAVEVVKEMAAGGNLDSILLCPGFGHEDVAQVAKAAGPSVGVSVARGDGRSMTLAHEAMKRAGWFSRG